MGGIGDSLEYRHTAFRGPVFPSLEHEARFHRRKRIVLERIFELRSFRENSRFVTRTILDSKKEKREALTVIDFH